MVFSDKQLETIKLMAETATITRICKGKRGNCRGSFKVVDHRIEFYRTTKADITSLILIGKCTKCGKIKEFGMNKRVWGLVDGVSRV